MAPLGKSVQEKETQLLLRVATQDREAYVELFSLVAPRVKGYLLSQKCSAAVAEELTQEVMVTVWRKAGLYNPAKAGALTWLFVLARNRWIDSLRRERSTVTYGLGPPEREETAQDTADIASDADRDRLVRDAMQQLPEEQRDVLYRSFFKGQTQQDIAAELNMPLGTVKSRMRLALAKLRLQLDVLR